MIEPTREAIDPEPRVPRQRKPPAEWKRTERLKRVKDLEPDFIGKAELARHLCCHINSIDLWIYDGTIPPPHSYPGTKHPVWLRKHYHLFRETGKWPAAAFGSR
ncbi:MAG: hypothetical protein KGR26_11580 [Cyanobacteria bacterium REEB65]|nr:hypothetical protein [Cyanobacteria bacterium REEB65]